jgi:plastocyanin domain-containing protein
MKSRLIAGAAVLIALAVFAWGCAQQGSSRPQTVRLDVTDRGFEPAEIKVHSGRPVTLLVTRKTDATCAKEIVIADAHVREELPLNQEVRITFTPETPGELRYACGMDMLTGSLRVE